MKKFLAIFLSIMMVVLFTACDSFKSYTWNLDTGDTLTIKLNTSNGETMTSEFPIDISDKSGNVIAKIGANEMSHYDNTISALKNGNAIINETDKDGMHWIEFAYDDGNGETFRYIVVDSSKKEYFVLEGAVGVTQETVEGLYDLLTIEMK